MMKGILLGTDPELFLVDKDNNYISSVGLVGGTKNEPRPIGNELGYGVQEDNVAVEFTVPPSSSEDELVSTIKKVLAFGLEVIPVGLSFANTCSAYFPEEQLQTEAARTFGCSPEKDAYTMDTFAVSAKDAHNFRTAGGHVHVGLPSKFSEEVKASIVISLDLFLGIPSLFLDKDTERRKLYGKAGSFRLKKYGLEYRVLSNFWIFKEELIRWVWKATNKAVEFALENQKLVGAGHYELPLLIQHCINEKDYESSKKLIKEFKLDEYCNSNLGAAWNGQNVLNEEPRPETNLIH